MCDALTWICRSFAELPFISRRTTVRLALVLAATAAWMSPTPATAAEILPITITVRVYQTAGLPSTVEERALTEAHHLLWAARVDVHWEKCSGLNPSPACAVPRGPADLLLVVREGTACEDTLGSLGAAVVVPRAGGVLATVYSNHVARLADNARTDVAVLLGRVAAHELGHLMMQTSSHARRGLMRPTWTPFEIRRNRAPDWAFTAGDMVAMRPPGAD